MSEMWSKIKEIIENKLLTFHKWLQDWITTKVFDDEWLWLEALIDILCQIEMYWYPITHKEFKQELNCMNIMAIEPNAPQQRSIAQQTIPEHTFYCQGCKYSSYSKIARFFYGTQCDGYCYYLGKGDFSFINSTDILWDGCKECGINEDIEEEYEIESVNTGDNL